MSVQIKNLTNRPVLIRFNSGRTLHLAPNAISTGIMEVEVNSNAQIHKLIERGTISKNPAEKSASTTEEPKKEKMDAPKGRK